MGLLCQAHPFGQALTDKRIYLRPVLPHHTIHRTVFINIGSTTRRCFSP